MIKRRKLYTKVEEGALYTESIISYAKVPYFRKVAKIDGKTITYIARYENRLIIDLWIIILRVKWLSKEL